VSFSSGGSADAGRADCGIYPVREWALKKLADIGRGAGGTFC